MTLFAAIFLVRGRGVHVRFPTPYFFGFSFGVRPKKKDKTKSSAHEGDSGSLSEDQTGRNGKRSGLFPNASQEKFLAVENTGVSAQASGQEEEESGERKVPAPTAGGSEEKEKNSNLIPPFGSEMPLRRWHREHPPLGSEMPLRRWHREHRSRKETARSCRRPGLNFLRTRRSWAPRPCRSLVGNSLLHPHLHQKHPSRLDSTLPLFFSGSVPAWDFLRRPVHPVNLGTLTGR
ncbi:hypothetical protein Bbelb_311820 [Branchiostoma belcheri]|nr:hypothetical protein Bbelb_311820 [Branchiostoma belcheri]